MATTSIDIDVHTEAAWAAIADPATYPTWLVGTKRMLAIDPDFPARGTRFHHEVGVGPLRIRDHSTVLESHARSRCLVLEVRARPVIGAARVEMTVLTAGVGRARVTIREEARSIPLGALLRPFADRMIKARNARSLDNLRGLLEAPDALPEVPHVASDDHPVVEPVVRRAPRRRTTGAARALA